eukprot:TRINITY_DN27668_c0_g1_i1.p1 TRINITY_DN27668_c0_g1~~TRINITY_DN27668_c0_g1_i1.p1  ORF type:complete len:367 (+),score=96.32 TRINITY_DN27668_c0_g1_i1:111-1211(+)
MCIRDRTFAVELSKPMVELKESGDAAAAALGALSDCARLDTCVTMVDGVHFWEQWESVQTVQEDSMGAEVAEDDERSLVGLLTEQVEFADVIVVNKTDLMKPDQILKLQGALRGMNTDAEILQADHAVVPLAKVLNTGRFNLDRASKAAGWMQELLKPGGHNPETLEYGIGSFIYRASKPFHPERLYEWTNAYFQITCDSGVDEEDSDSDSEDEVEEPKTPAELRACWSKVHGASRLLRSKGLMWVACYHGISVNWNQVGQMGYLTLGAAWNDGVVEKTEHMQLPEDHTFGDRRSELVFIGQDIDREKLTKELDACLLQEEEMGAGLKSWVEELEDPFEMLPEEYKTAVLVDGHVHSEECGHGHSH